MHCTHPALDTTFGDTCYGRRELCFDNVLTIAMDLLNTTLRQELNTDQPDRN